MQLEFPAKCVAVEQGDGAELVEFERRESDADDVPGSYAVASSIKLTLRGVDRGKFQSGEAYAVGLTILPAGESGDAATTAPAIAEAAP